jgi:hypothetical protein
MFILSLWWQFLKKVSHPSFGSSQTSMLSFTSHNLYSLELLFAHANWEKPMAYSSEPTIFNISRKESLPVTAQVISFKLYQEWPYFQQYTRWGGHSLVIEIIFHNHFWHWKTLDMFVGNLGGNINSSTTTPSAMQDIVGQAWVRSTYSSSRQARQAGRQHACTQREMYIVCLVSASGTQSPTFFKA